MAEKILVGEKKVRRHGVITRLIHWLVALSTFALLFSGFGQMPMYKRYMLDQVPGLGWSSDFFITLNIHYVAAIVLIFTLVFHLIYHGLRKETLILPRKGDFKESYLIIKAMLTGGIEPESHKYLPEQRLAYAFIGINLILVTVSGIVKVLKNLPGIELSQSLISLSTNLHNIATVLTIFGIIGHLAAFVPKINRFLLPGMFNGKIDFEYAKHRHSLWVENIKKQ